VVSECEHFPNEDAVDAVIEGRRSWSTMAEDAVNKYREGVTTLEELHRVFGSSVDEYLKEDSP
jgi:general secretion pathway protein E